MLLIEGAEIRVSISEESWRKRSPQSRLTSNCYLSSGGVFDRIPLCSSHACRVQTYQLNRIFIIKSQLGLFNGMIVICVLCV